MAAPKNQPYVPHQGGSSVVRFGRTLENTAPTPVAISAFTFQPPSYRYSPFSWYSASTLMFPLAIR